MRRAVVCLATPSCGVLYAGTDAAAASRAARAHVERDGHATNESALA